MSHLNCMKHLLNYTTMKCTAIMMLLIHLSSCGFHLQGTHGQVSTTPLSIQLTNELPRDWQLALYQQLTRAQISVSEDAPLHLKLSQFTEEKRVVTLNQRAKASEYELVIGFSYVILKHEVPVTQKAHLSASRSYEFVETQVVGKAHEETLIRTQLQRQLFRRLLQQLRRAADHAS